MLIQFPPWHRPGSSWHSSMSAEGNRVQPIPGSKTRCNLRACKGATLQSPPTSGVGGGIHAGACRWEAATGHRFPGSCGELCRAVRASCENVWGKMEESLRMVAMAHDSLVMQPGSPLLTRSHCSTTLQGLLCANWLVSKINLMG